jgi:hypothetical protein
VAEQRSSHRPEGVAIVELCGPLVVADDQQPPVAGEAGPAWGAHRYPRNRPKRRQREDLDAVFAMCRWPIGFCSLRRRAGSDLARALGKRDDPTSGRTSPSCGNRRGWRFRTTLWGRTSHTRRPSPARHNGTAPRTGAGRNERVQAPVGGPRPRCRECTSRVRAHKQMRSRPAPQGLAARAPDGRGGRVLRPTGRGPHR